MGSRVRLGCFVTLFLVGLLAVVFWRPIAQRAANWMFDETTVLVTRALPAEEGAGATALCEALWTAVRTKGIAPEHAEAFAEFRRFVWGVVKNEEVTPEEAREFVRRAREMLGRIDPDRLAALDGALPAASPDAPPGRPGDRK